MQSADMYMEETRKDQQAHSLKTNPITFSCFLAVFFLCPVCLGRGKLISHGNFAYSSVEHFSRPYSQWCGKYIPWPCQRCKGQLSFLFLYSLFHLLRTALCPSIARLHCLLITFLRLVASLFLSFWLQESKPGLLISWPAVLFAHTCGFRLPGGGPDCVSASRQLTGGRTVLPEVGGRALKLLSVSLAGVDLLS